MSAGNATRSVPPDLADAGVGFEGAPAGTGVAPPDTVGVAAGPEVGAAVEGATRVKGTGVALDPGVEASQATRIAAAAFCRSRLSAVRLVNRSKG
jgi:hypothetical protein